MKYLLLIFLTVFAYSQSIEAQIFTETFNNFFPDSTPSYAFWPMDNTTYPPNSINDRSGNSKNLSVSTATAGQKQASILVADGYSEDFNASGTLARSDDAYWNALSTSGFSFVCAIRYASLTGSLFTFTRDDGSSNRQFGFLTNGTQARFYCFQTAGEFRRPSSGLSLDTWYLFVGIFDTTGTGSINLYRNGVASAEGVSGTINDTLRTITGIVFSVSGIHSGTLDMDADVSLLALYNRALAAKEAKEFGYLANGWNSAGGNVTRSNFAFHQGVSGSGLTVKTKATGAGDGFTYSPTLTGSSVTYTHREALPFEFDTDSLLIVTDTDSIWKAIPDTILATTDSLQITFDAHETGGAVYIDNISISGYTIPSASFSADPTSGTAPLEVTFTNTSTGNIDSVAWDFDDGSDTTHTENPTHTYTSAGSYNAQLIAYGPATNDTTSTTITVTEAPASAPKSNQLLPFIHYHHYSGYDAP